MQKPVIAIFAAVSVALSVATAGAAPPPHGAPAKGHATAKHAARPLDAAAATALAARLKSGDAAAIKGALDEIRLAGKSAASLAPAIDVVLRTGATPELAVAAMATAGDLGAPASSAALRPWSRHRRPELRRAAVKALVKTGGPDAVAALRDALSDADAIVRGISASGLGSLHAKESVDQLFTALDHRVPEAAAAVGELCTGAPCDKLLAKLGVLAFDIVVSGLDPMMFRPASEVTDDQKLKIVEQVRALGTADANKYLRDVQGRWPHASSAKVKQAIDLAVTATNGAIGGAP